MSEMSEQKLPRPGYWAVIPAAVRYDDRIPASAKVLYAEMSALAERDGYCWAGNDYFARVFQLTEKSVRRQLAALAEAGYIRIEELRGNHNVVEDRKIYIGLNPLADAPPLDKKVQPLDKKVQRLLINKNNNIPPISPADALQILKRLPEEAAGAVLDAAGEDPELLCAWLDFLDMRQKKHAPVKTLRTVELLEKKLQQLSRGDDRAAALILQQSVERSWTGLFELKDDRAAGRADRGGGWADDPEVYA